MAAVRDHKMTLVLCTFVQKATRVSYPRRAYRVFPEPPHAAFVASRSAVFAGLGPVAVFADASTVALLGGVGRARLSRPARRRTNIETVDSRRRRRSPILLRVASPARRLRHAVRVMRAAQFPRAEVQSHRRHRVFPRIVGGALGLDDLAEQFGGERSKLERFSGVSLERGVSRGVAAAARGMVDAEALEVVREIVADEEGPSVVEDGEDARANVVDRGRAREGFGRDARERGRDSR